MTRNFGRHIVGKWSGAGLNISQVTIEAWQRCARTNDSQINGNATRIAKKLFRSIHQFASQACTLAFWFHSEQAQVAAITADLHIDAARKASGIFREQEFSFLHVFANAVGINAIALDEWQFDAKSSIDQRREGLHVRTLSETKLRFVPAWKRIRCGAHGIV